MMLCKEGDIESLYSDGECEIAKTFDTSYLVKKVSEG